MWKVFVRKMNETDARARPCMAVLDQNDFTRKQGFLLEIKMTRGVAVSQWFIKKPFSMAHILLFVATFIDHIESHSTKLLSTIPLVAHLSFITVA